MKKLIWLFITTLVAGLLCPQTFKMPVKGADNNNYHPQSFWYYPWGKSGTHKGVDIFAKAGTEVFSSTYGLVLYQGQIKMGGNVVFVLGPKWRVHYYAHLEEIKTSTLNFVTPADTIGTIGTSGNAVGKQPHLHYSIATLLPYIWRVDKGRQGWKKIFYLNPIEYLL